MSNGIFITGDLYYDVTKKYPILTPLGPFESKEYAYEWVYFVEPFGKYELTLLPSDTEDSFTIEDELMIYGLALTNMRYRNQRWKIDEKHRASQFYRFNRNRKTSQQSKSGGG